MAKVVTFVLGKTDQKIEDLLVAAATVIRVVQCAIFAANVRQLIRVVTLNNNHSSLQVWPRCSILASDQR